MSFVHLRLHTEFSVVDGTLRIDDAVAAARADGQGALAISDLDNLFGAVKFYKACRGAGIKPLIGVDVWMEPLPDGGNHASRLLLLVQDAQGYLNVCELLARAWTRNVQRTQAWVKWEWLRELGGGLIALSGADQGVLGAALLAGDGPRARRRDGAAGVDAAADVGGAEHADFDAAGHRLIDHRAHDDMRVAPELLGHGRHDLVHLGQREVGASGDVHEQALGLAGELRGGEQRAELETLDGLGHGLVALA